ncbi:hypothetical protein [Pseudobacteriovorax antillogorgiicola]|uniref:Uncharacterized protein n=1 Tax=Pseudobacteriovorax antillogorgiicola TaxID=1513793 RepID=A0A1Y6C3M8_9BACT|nr:hypothetical protein [Pseudobacteriovorax antillogorgiicola]TCS49867.1 hypothetical protein EDD56_114112 [Pseudobacteriovorax antillogorgiicola]SMF43916.1 hypothetical protein SAMN06296036_113111 [Pseudobacteriovorax antillogorgiicola]
MKRLAFSLMGMAVLSACGTQVESSKVMDIASPGNSGQENMLLYLDDATATVASCDKGVEPTRSNCPILFKAKKDMVELQVKQTISSELAELRSAYEREIKRLKDNDILILDFQMRIAQLDQETARLGEDIAIVEGEIAVVQEDIDDLSSKQAAKKNQLDKVETAIMQLGASDELLALRLQLKSEIRDLDFSISKVTREKQSLEGQVEDLNFEVDATEARRRDLNEDMLFTYETLEVSSAESDRYAAGMKRQQEKLDLVPRFSNLLATDFITFRLINMDNLKKELFAAYIAAIEACSKPDGNAGKDPVHPVK